MLWLSSLDWDECRYEMMSTHSMLCPARHSIRSIHRIFVFVLSVPVLHDGLYNPEQKYGYLHLKLH